MVFKFIARLFPEPVPCDERAAKWLTSELARPMSDDILIRALLNDDDEGPPSGKSAVPAVSVRCADSRPGNEHKPKERAKQLPSQERIHNNNPARITRSRLTVVLTECSLVANKLFVPIEACGG